MMHFFDTRFKFCESFTKRSQYLTQTFEILLGKALRLIFKNTVGEIFKFIGECFTTGLAHFTQQR